MVKIAKCFSVFLFVLIISLTFSNTSNAESYLNRTVNERSRYYGSARVGPTNK